MKYRKEYGEALVRFFATAEALPSFVQFALHLDTDTATLRRWREKHPAFRRAWQQAEEILCDRVAEGAIHRRLDGSFAKFFLAAKHGWSDKEEEKGEDSFTLKVTVE